MSPDVTAVITTHARPARVCEALASLRLETHQNIEVILVDDGVDDSVDDGGAYLAPGHDGEAALRVLRGTGLGVGAARNLGLASARGQYIIFLDDDDVAMPQRIERLVRVARAQHATLCFGMTRRVMDGTNEVLGIVPTHLLSTGAVGFRELLNCAPHVNAVLARTESLRAIGGFDEGAHHFDDWSAWLRMADRNPNIWCIPDTVADWRIHEQGLSAQVLQGGVMKARLLSLFDRLRPSLSSENAAAVTAARDLVQSATIVTYDDYADTMALAGEALHADGSVTMAETNNGGEREDRASLYVGSNRDLGHLGGRPDLSRDDGGPHLEHGPAADHRSLHGSG